LLRDAKSYFFKDAVKTNKYLLTAKGMELFININLKLAQIKISIKIAE